MKHKVLIVDDEPNVLEGLQRALRTEPYKILSANSGHEALVLLKSFDIDAIVVDQDMPGMKGTDVLEHVCRLYPNIVRYMLTGNATLELAMNAINDGAISRFFTKPCNPTELADSIRQGLQNKDRMTEAAHLLKRSRPQETILEELEETTPGITRVEMDEHGTILLGGNDSVEYDALIDELRAQVD